MMPHDLVIEGVELSLNADIPPEISARTDRKWFSHFACMRHTTGVVAKADASGSRARGDQ